jgi:hypothetical protein
MRKHFILSQLSYGNGSTEKFGAGEPKHDPRVRPKRIVAYSDVFAGGWES